MKTRKGTVFQKYKVKLVADVPGTGSSKDGEVQQVPAGTTELGGKGAAEGSGDKGDGSQGVQGEDLGPYGNTSQLQFNNFQDRIDYAMQHALINQYHLRETPAIPSNARRPLSPPSTNAYPWPLLHFSHLPLRLPRLQSPPPALEP
uniref:Uncharacterized protein n=2 Tax=Oryza sativa subsp. japonica TaxID=39947 RepID=Q53KQ0_ORYSJ|nr:hypothetical protein LOC_Os11g15660 [Oryza sativa Japonica Group]ABA92470.1 hypothetical protein LOC_Os11g15660 [Oryza sativa Japonica Group]